MQSQSNHLLKLQRGERIPMRKQQMGSSAKSICHATTGCAIVNGSAKNHTTTFVAMSLFAVSCFYTVSLPAQTRSAPPHFRPVQSVMPQQQSPQQQAVSQQRTATQHGNSPKNIRWTKSIFVPEKNTVRYQQPKTQYQQTQSRQTQPQPRQAQYQQSQYQQTQPQHQRVTHAIAPSPVRPKFQTYRQLQTKQPVQQIQHFQPPNAAKPLPQQISAMPTRHENMTVIHHRSQLLIAHNQILRTAIADSSVIDVAQFSPHEVSIIGLGLGTTTLTIWFVNNPQPLLYLVKIIRDPSLEEQRRLDYGRLERKIQILFPNSKVYLIPLSGKIIIKGQARSASEAARILQIVRNEVINQDGRLGGPQQGSRNGVNNTVTGGVVSDPVGNPVGNNGAGTGRRAADLAASYIVNMLEVPGEAQVMLRVRIAELNRSQLRRLGIDINHILNGGRHVVNYAMGGLPSTFSGVFENGEINVLVNWLSSNGTAKILSEPVLTVLSGHRASMLSGGEFAVPTIVGIGGAQGQQTSFRGFGTSLNVTPTVLDNDLIHMHIVPEFSQINSGNAVNGVPGLDSRRVDTTVRLREGQTIAIAGLISHRESTEVARIPFLSDIPYIGSKLFSTKKSTMDETELLILVTPELVRPMDADEVPPVPGFNVTSPNDAELYEHGMTEGAPHNEVYQLAPYGRGAGVGEPVGYRLHNPSPATPGYSPAVTNPYGQPHRGNIRQPNVRQPNVRQPNVLPQRKTPPTRFRPQQTVPPLPQQSRYRPQYAPKIQQAGRTLPERFFKGQSRQATPAKKSFFPSFGRSRTLNRR